MTISRRNKRGGSSDTSSSSTKSKSPSHDSVIQKLYSKMPKEIPGGKKITDDLVAWFDNSSKTYYVGLHAKDYNGTDNMTQPFVVQMNAFADWVMTDVNPIHTVILASDFNTECIIHPNSPDTLIYSNKDGKETQIQQTFNDRRIIKSSTDFYTTNKMRFITAQLPKIYLAAKSKIDHIICFKPIFDYNIEVINLKTKQIACESGQIAFRTSDCYQESAFPSDHDAVLFNNVATFNCCSSGASFDGKSLAHNTYEFFTDDMFTIFTNEANKKIVMKTYLAMLSNLNENGLFDLNGKIPDEKFTSNGLFSKDIDIFSKSRGEVFDIHLHSSFVPLITMTLVGTKREFSFTHTDKQILEQESIAANDEKRLRYALWKTSFDDFLKTDPYTINKTKYTPDAYMEKIGIILLNVWHELLRNETLKPHFDTWYDNSSHAHPRKLVVDFLFTSGAKVVALQEIKIEDINTVKKLFITKDGYRTIWNGRSVNGLSTVGCIIIKQ
jgi:hypothetical protein